MRSTFAMNEYANCLLMVIATIRLRLLRTNPMAVPFTPWTSIISMHDRRQSRVGCHSRSARLSPKTAAIPSNFVHPSPCVGATIPPSANSFHA